MSDEDWQYTEEPVSPNDVIAHGNRWLQERDEARTEAKRLREELTRLHAIRDEFGEPAILRADVKRLRADRDQALAEARQETQRAERLRKALADVADDAAFLVSAHLCGEPLADPTIEGVRTHVREARELVDAAADDTPRAMS